MEDKFFDLRKFNVTNIDEAISFLEVIAAKLPQVQVVLNGAKIEQQSLFNRVEHAEGKQRQAETSAANELSVGARLSGAVPMPFSGGTVAPEITQAQRLEQMRAAGEANPAPQPGDLGTINAPAPTVPPAPTTPVEPQQGTGLPDPDQLAALGMEGLDLSAIANGEQLPPSGNTPDGGAQPPIQTVTPPAAG